MPGAAERKPRRKPNTLLRLLQDMHAARSWKALYLASATPMQMHAHEAWDLLDLLGLSGAWAGSAENFVRYYAELRKRSTSGTGRCSRRMAADYASDPNARADEALENAAKAGARHGRCAAGRAHRLSDGITPMAAKGLPRPRGRSWTIGCGRTRRCATGCFAPLARHCVSTRRKDCSRRTRTFRVRHVADRFIPMTAEEEHLYDASSATSPASTTSTSGRRPGPTRPRVHHDRLPPPPHLLVSGDRTEPATPP